MKSVRLEIIGPRFNPPLGNIVLLEIFVSRSKAFDAKIANFVYL